MSDKTRYEQECDDFALHGDPYQEHCDHEFNARHDWVRETFGDPGERDFSIGGPMFTPVRLTFPAGWDPFALDDRAVAEAVRALWLDAANRDLADAVADAWPEDYPAPPADHATLTAEDLPDTEQFDPAELTQDAETRAAVERFLDAYGRDVPL